MSELSKALLVAQKAVATVGKDAENKFGKFRYASAEAVIEAAANALEKAGLTFSTLRVYGIRNEEEHNLSITYLLEHGESGESREYTSCAAVIDKAGTPRDKAEAIAMTTNLSYTMRGLLLIKRGDDTDEMNKRDDSTFVPSQPVANVEELAMLARIETVKDITELNVLTAELKGTPLAQNKKVRAAFSAKLASFSK